MRWFEGHQQGETKHLGGRIFDVLMTSLPLALLQNRLDEAAHYIPRVQRSPTFAQITA